MSAKQIILSIFAALCFSTLVLYLLVENRANTAASRKAPAAPTSFGGRLDIQRIDDLRVGGRKIILCGVSFAKPPALEQLARDQARRAFQGVDVICTAVGNGTPCDGRVAPRFNDAVVAQCFTADKRDIAAELSARKILCDRAGQSGGVYPAC